MYKNFTVIEVTKENENKYLDRIVKLEDDVYENMIKQGKEGQLFTTGREDISGYINSDNNSVFIVTRNNDEEDVIAATYITQGQIPFTYNDVTKYFKCSEEYMESVKKEYETEEAFLEDLRKVYIQKITAFVYSRDFILRNYTENIHKLSEEEKNALFMKLVEQEIQNPENNFHEKSYIREDINKYMSLYMSKIFRNSDLYEKFYWADMDYINSQYGDEQAHLNNNGLSKYDSTIKAYDTILSLQKYPIFDKSEGIDEEKYHQANTDNTIELDTYITSDSVREFGLARIIVFEGIKRVLKKQHMDEKDGSIYLVSTLHRDNLSSKYVSEFFGLKDNLFVKRRTGRNREVHICKIDKCRMKEYLAEMEKKLVVLYNYNPKGIFVSDDDKKRIFNEQLLYEKKELARLEKINNSKYDSYAKMKKDKISKLEKTISDIEDTKEIK